MDQESELPSIDETLREVARTRRIASALLHGAAAAEIDDVLQDVSIAALAPGVPRGAGFAGWIRGAVRHLSLTVLRRRTSRSSREREAARPVALPAADDVAHRLALQRVLLAEVEALAEPMRSAIVRRYLDEVSPRVIARELNVPLATVKTRLRRGLARLREKLSREWGEELGGILIRLASVGGGGAATTAMAGASTVAAIGATLLGSKARALLVASTVVVIAGATLPLLGRFRRSDEGASGGAVAEAPQSSPTGDGRARLVAATPSSAAAVRVRDDATPKPAPPGSRRARLGERRLGVLAGRVVDENGEGRGGVAVTIVRPVEAELNFAQLATDPRRLGERHETTTAADGTFAFEELVRGSKFDLFAAAGDGRRANRLDVPVGHDAATLTLKTTRRVDGIVVDARNGTPVAGAIVRAINHRADGRQRLEATTDGSGRFAIPDVEGDYVTLLAAAPDGRCSGSCSPSLDRLGSQPVTMKVGPGGAAAGTVVDEANGEPIADAAILLQPESEVIVTRTDERGEFTLRPTYAGSAGKLYAIAVASDGSWTQFELTLAKEPDDPPTSTLVRMRRGRHATGRIFDRDGLPVSGAVLVASYGTETKHACGPLATTRSDGSFTLSGIPPRSRPEILVRHDDCEWTAIPFSEGDAGDGDVDLGTIRIGCGAFVSGTVVGEDGRPSADGSVMLVRGEPRARSAACDAQGRFEFAGVRAGRVTLQASVRSGAKPAELALDVHEDEIVEPVRLTIPTGLSISGLVVDADGAPVAGALLWLQRAGANGRPTVNTLNSDEHGRFAFFGLDRGTCQLRVTPPHSPTSRALPTRVDGVEAGAADLRLTLPNGAFVTGRVVDGHGAAIPGADVRLHGSDASVGGTASTDRDGRFSVLVAADAELSLDVRIVDPRHPGPLMEKPPAATREHIRAGGGPLEIVVERD